MDGWMHIAERPSYYPCLLQYVVTYTDITTAHCDASCNIVIVASKQSLFHHDVCDDADKHDLAQIRKIHSRSRQSYCSRFQVRVGIAEISVAEISASNTLRGNVCLGFLEAIVCCIVQFTNPIIVRAFSLEIL